MGLAEIHVFHFLCVLTGEYKRLSPLTTQSLWPQSDKDQVEWYLTVAEEKRAVHHQVYLR